MIMPNDQEASKSPKEIDRLENFTEMFNNRVGAPKKVEPPKEIDRLENFTEMFNNRFN